jgi:Family of unknown function (DUF6510)
VQDKDLRLDGNAAAGLLGEVFGSEVTLHSSTCGGCGATNQVGALMAYVHAMGTVLRCPGCDGALVRITHARGRYWIDLSGMSCLEIGESSQVV